jgi:enamine deaminase RidA (YjgF/YER057c/UK114 family)
MKLRQRLKELGLRLPAPPKPAGNYQPWILAGKVLYISGQFPIENGEIQFRGQVGNELTEDQGMAAAQMAALNVLAQMHAALGDLNKLKTLIRVEGHVASAENWFNAPMVLNAASDVFVRVLGRRGHHSRTAFGPRRLPLNAAVELVITAAVR